MKLDDALSLLGVTRDTDVANGRRAYLRLLKKHPPERDPEGFKQLRAAYELARPYFRGTSPEEPTPIVVAVEPPLIPPTVANQDLPGPEPVGTLSLQAQHELSLADRFWDEDEPAVREEIAREAVRQTRSLESYQLLLEALDSPDRRAEFVAAAREAVAYGHPEGLDRICDRWPSALTDKELDALRERGERSVEWPRLAIAYVERGRVSTAAEIARASLAREVADPLAPRASWWWIIKLITAMFKTAPAEAVPIFRAVDRSLGEAASDRDIPAVQRLLLRELAVVCMELPIAVCSVIASSIDEGDSATARDDLMAFAGEQPKLAKQAAAALKLHAPELAAHYGEVLQGKDPYRLPWYGADWKVPWWTVFVLLNMIRLACQDSCSSSHQSSPVDVDQLRARTVHEPEEVLCADRASALCTAARSWAHAQDCPKLFETMQVLEREFAAAGAAGKVSDAQNAAFLSATKTTSGVCERPTTGSLR